MKELKKKEDGNKMRMIRDLLIAVVLLFGIAFCSYYSFTYTRTAIVTKVENGKVTVTEKDGYVWEFYGDGFSVNDYVEMTMDTNNTDSTIKDDIVKKVKKIK